MKNEGFFERGLQAAISAILLLLAVFWLGGAWAYAAGILSLVIVFFAAVGFCPLYKLLGIKKQQLEKNVFKKSVAIILVYLSLLVGGGYASNFFSKKFFIEDFNAMNVYYKQTLFETGQEKRIESIENYNKLVNSYAAFENKYITYRPYALRFDKYFEDDLKKIEKIISLAKDEVYNGDLKKAHLEFEKVRTITQDIFKRNGFSMLALALVDFHDSMEKLLNEAEEKNAEGVIFAYTEADNKLAAVEMEDGSEEIKSIRKNLEDILQMAKEGAVENLPVKAAELKSSFVKVYLNRG